MPLLYFLQSKAFQLPWVRSQNYRNLLQLCMEVTPLSEFCSCKAGFDFSIRVRFHRCFHHIHRHLRYCCCTLSCQWSKNKLGEDFFPDILWNFVCLLRHNSSMHLNPCTSKCSSSSIAIHHPLSYRVYWTRYFNLVMNSSNLVFTILWRHRFRCIFLIFNRKNSLSTVVGLLPGFQTAVPCGSFIQTSHWIFGNYTYCIWIHLLVHSSIH